MLLASDRPGGLASSRPEDALRPPPLTIGNLARDLVRHIEVYGRNRLGLGTALAFSVLRLLQHLAYNRGWHTELRPAKSPSVATRIGLTPAEQDASTSG